MAHELPTDQEISKREWMLVAFLVVLGGVLRILFIGSFHVEHFDEGVYASNRWFTADEGARYPDRHLYAPPLWPAVLEYSQLLFGPTSLGAMLPGILCGTLAIGLLWRLLRNWVGREEALLVAGLLALSGFHILFSRTALTDVPVTLLMLWGIGRGWSSLSRSNWPAAVGAGFITGLAWSVKYNGWFPLAVTGAGLAAATISDFGFSILDSGSHRSRKRGGRGEESGDGPHAKQSQKTKNKQQSTKHNRKSKIQNPKSAAWGCWLLMVAVAGVVWFPAWWDLQSAGRGGYAAVAANHAGYLTGWDNWLEQFRIQFANLGWFDDRNVFLALLGLLALLIVFDPLSRRRRDDSAEGRSSRLADTGHLYLVVALVIFFWFIDPGSGMPRLWFTLALFGLGVRLVTLISAARHGQPVTPQILAGWMALAWVASLLLLTPLYRPYPRLALPLYFALLVGTAFGLQELKRLFQADETDAGRKAAAGSEQTGQPVSRGTRTRLALWGMVCIAIGYLLVDAPVTHSKAASPWQSRLSMEEASQQIVEACNQRSAQRLTRPVAYMVYVYGEPALYYHLCRLAPENVVIAPVANLGFISDPPGREPVPIYLVTGPHTFRDPNYPRQREQAGDRLAHVVGCEVRVSDLMLLNAYSPREIAESGDITSQVTIELLERRPADSVPSQ